MWTTSVWFIGVFALFKSSLCLRAVAEDMNMQQVSLFFRYITQIFIITFSEGLENSAELAYLNCVQIGQLNLLFHTYADLVNRVAA